ncbi:MAG: hypothetical protein QHC89_07085 [Bosea sp. (in: a-proteobacteria)]|nr:hypothetical protein [Bosea sp. (in: a-proteobacteria)]
MRLMIAAAIVAGGLFASIHGASAQQVGGWRKGWGQGVTELSVKNGSGNELLISCNDFSPEGSILIQIHGDGPRPGTFEKIILDAEEFTGPFNTECRSCNANFVAVLQKLPRAKSMLVQFSDGRSSSFSLKGAAKAIQSSSCAPRGKSR